VFTNDFCAAITYVQQAPDEVLQCIEQALDTSVLTLRDATSATNHTQTIRRHPEFRLFATQNPSTGSYKGKREVLSKSLLDRFVILQFAQLQQSEWVEVLHSKLVNNSTDTTHSTEMQAIAFKLVQFHAQFVQLLPQSNVTMRELLKVVKHMIAIDNGTDDDKVAYTLLCVYGGRYSDSKSKLIVQQLIRDMWREPEATESTQMTVTQEAVTVGAVQLKRDGVTLNNSTDRHFAEAINDAINNDVLRVMLTDDIVDQIAAAHSVVMQVVTNEAALSKYGIQRGAAALWCKWLQAANAAVTDSIAVPEFVAIGAQIYTDSVRSASLKKQILACFKQAFGSSFDEKLIRADNKSTARNSVTAPCPIALTPRFTQALQQLAHCLTLQQPALISSSAVADGASTMVAALAEICDTKCHLAVLTAETEAALLVGAQTPVSNDTSSAQSIQWCNGTATRALASGDWLLLDNIGETAATVLERLNPLLEDKTQWVLTENGAVTAMDVPTTFRVLATTATGKTMQTLSPALLNRFTIISLQSLPCAEEEFKEEISILAYAITGIDDKATVTSVVQIGWYIWQQLLVAKTLSEKVSFRMLVRLLDCTYHIQQMHTGDTDTTSNSRLTVATAVYAATELVFKGLFTVADDATKFIDSVTKQIGHVFGLGTSDIISSTVPARVQELLASNDTQYYLTDQRQSYASRICAATQCGLPCLLEVREYNT
jgi:midasin (ATPase involved in ribosome maturation)